MNKTTNLAINSLKDKKKDISGDQGVIQNDPQIGHNQTDYTSTPSLPYKIHHKTKYIS